jgi:hypothetical protein
MEMLNLDTSSNHSLNGVKTSQPLPLPNCQQLDQHALIGFPLASIALLPFTNVNSNTPKIGAHGLNTESL